MVAPQTFALGSDWPYWGEDVCLELAVHRRALKEGWIPQAWEVPDMDSDLVTYLECQHKTAEGGCCSFHIRVEVDEELKRNIAVQVCAQHNHATVPIPSKEEAAKSIVALERILKKSALEELYKVKRTGSRNRPKPSVLRAKQWVILGDVEIALGRIEMEKSRAKAQKKNYLVLEDDEAVQIPTPESTPTSSRRQPPNSSRPANSPSQRSPTTATSSSSSSVSAEASSNPTQASSKPSSAVSPPAPLPSSNSSAQRPSPSNVAPRRPSPTSPTSTILAEKAKKLSSQGLPFSGNFFETPSWPDLHSFRTALTVYSSLFDVDYDQAWPIVLPGTDHSAMSLSMFGTPDPPQLAYRCTEQGCLSKIVIDRRENGTYALQTARTIENHNHGGRLPSPVPGNPAITPAVAPVPIVPITPILSQPEPSPRPVSKKRAIEEPIPSTSSKRSTAQLLPTSGIVAASDIGEHRVASPVDGSDDSAIVESPNTHSPSRNSIRQDSPSPRLSPNKPSPELAIPPRTAPPIPTLAEYLSSLDSSGAYDFSEYFEALVRRGITTVAQLRLWAKTETRFKFLMQALQKADETGPREEGGKAGEVSLDAGEFRREIFKELFLGDCER